MVIIINKTDVLVVDFSRAFDQVDHDIFCHRLSNYEINGNMNSWIKNVLKDCTQSVVLDGSFLYVLKSVETHV